VRFETERERKIFIDDIRSTKLMASRFGSGHHVARFDPARFDFAGEIKKLLAEKELVSEARIRDLPLARLHEALSDSQKALDESELNAVSKAFYETGAGFLRVYRRFIRDVVAPLFGEDLYFQETPTLRFQFPGQQGFNWRPRIHTDIMLGHPPAEVNIWLPFTRAFATNTMLIASLEDSSAILEDLDYDFATFALRVQKDQAFWQACAKKMRPAELEFGELLLFDPRCLHATQNNDTNATRISMDVRVILRKQLETLPLEYRGTGRRRMLFAPGHYYHERSVSELAA
jgi:sporadic carbohydrate cluster 2OG-Fe(II) oxygenase